MKMSKLLLPVFLFILSNLVAQQKIYWANNNVGIMSANIDGTDSKTIIKNRILRINSHDIDTINNKIFWTDDLKILIGKSNLDGSNSEIFTGLASSSPSNIRVDNINNKVYWLERATKKLLRANLDGTAREIVISNLPDGYNAFELDIKSNKIYWLDGTNSKIVKTNLDFSIKEDIAIGGQGVFIGSFKLDYINKKIYWALIEYADSVKNTIKTKTFEGLDEKTIFSKKYSTSNFFLFEFEINPVQNTIYIIDQFAATGALGFLIGKLDGTGLSVPFGWGISPTFSTHRTDLKNNKIYAIGGFNGGAKIYQLSISLTPPNAQYTYQAVTKETIISPNGIAVDKNAGKIYFTDPSNDKIQRSNLDGSNIEDLVSVPFSSPMGIALDLVNKHMYWTERRTNTIKRANLDGSNVQIILRDLQIFPDCIALDIPNKKIYYILEGLSGLYRANFDGTGRALVFRSLSIMNQFALDLDNRKIYWSEAFISKAIGSDAIIRTNMDAPPSDTIFATKRDTIFRKSFKQDGGIALDVTNKKIYWIIDSTLQRVNFDGTNPVNLTNNLPDKQGWFGGYMTWGASHSYVSGEIVSKIKETEEMLNAKVFPTIFHDNVNIELKETANEPIQYHFYDMIGRLVLKGVLHDSKTINDVSSLENGFYLLKIMSSNKIYSTKLIKQ
jgi:Secretion system C-terminal sorting domain/Low-density lipoprotein receptor repeat class B